jgi:hypothetical protein
VLDLRFVTGAGAAQHLAGLIAALLLDQPSRRERLKEHSDSQSRPGGGSEAQHPAPVVGGAFQRPVDEVGGKDAADDH